VLKADIRPGLEYAFREKRATGVPFQRVRILEHLRGNKWKAEWIDPNPGLVHYVESAQLIVAWKEHKAFLREEGDASRLMEHNTRSGYQCDSALDNALSEVFESVGGGVSFYRGTLRGRQEAFERVRVRAGLAPEHNSPVAYFDRAKTLHVPFDEAVELARKFCAAEPATVLAKIEATEREWAEEARRPGEEYLIPLLNKYRAAWALVRQWAGHDAAVAEREAHIVKLERLVWDAIYALQKAKLDSEAARLRRAIERK
jgi:hypothetical protein